ncbi:helix-turn-helix domain-containing protein [Saccharopolyspora erythraea]|nr:helix-turn-helix domain-containing protein [Saccharopolyspora erythraea]
MSERQREAAVALFEAGYGAKVVAARLGVSRTAVRRLRHRWVLRGAGALIMKPKQSFSFEFKLEVVRRFLDGEATTAELAREYALSSPKLVETWVRKYRREGEDALRPKRRGRPEPVKWFVYRTLGGSVEVGVEAVGEVQGECAEGLFPALDGGAFDQACGGVALVGG